MTSSELGTVYTTGDNPRTSVIVWTSNGSYSSVPYTEQMSRLVALFGNRVLFLWVFKHLAAKHLNRIWSEFTYSQW